MMLTGDFPRFPFGIKEKHLLFVIFSSTRLYVLLLACSFLLYIFSKGIDFKRITAAKFLARPFAALSAAFILSTIFSQDLPASREALFMFLSIGLFLFLFSLMLEEEEVVSLLGAIIPAAIIFLVLRVILWRVSEGLGFGTFHIRNNSWIGKLQITWVLNLFAPFLLGQFLVNEERGHDSIMASNKEGGHDTIMSPIKERGHDTIMSPIRMANGAAWVLSGTAIALLYQRNSFVVFILTGVLMCLFHRRYWKRWLIFALFGLMLIPIGLKNTRRSSFLIWSLFNVQKDPGMRVRLGIWKETLRMFQDHPVTGMGLGTYDELAYSRYHTSYDNMLGGLPNWFYRNGWHAHNSYLHILAEAGLVGFSAYLFLWSTLLAESLRRWRSLQSDSAKSCAASLFCGVLAFLILSLTEHLIGVRVYASLRMNFTLGFMVLYGLEKS